MNLSNDLDSITYIGDSSSFDFCIIIEKSSPSPVKNVVSLVLSLSL